MSRSGIRAIAVLATLALLGWYVHARTKPDSELNGLDQVLLSATGPVQAGMTSLADAITGSFDHYVTLVGVSRANEQLRDDLAEARSAAAELNALRVENDRLRGLVELRGRTPSVVAAASVLGRGTSGRFKTLRIDRGTDSGVQEGMPVLAVGGVVGRVLRSARNYADVLLLTDGLSTAGVRVERSGLRGLAAGVGGSELEMRFVRTTELGAIAEGDLLVASGEDEVFPEGVPLGEVSRVATPESGIFLDVTLRPLVQLDRVDELLVVLEKGHGPFSMPPLGGEGPAQPGAEEVPSPSLGRLPDSSDQDGAAGVSEAAP